MSRFNKINVQHFATLVQEIDTDAFHFHTKEGKVWYFGQKWLGRPLEVYID